VEGTISLGFHRGDASLKDMLASAPLLLVKENRWMSAAAQVALSNNAATAVSSGSAVASGVTNASGRTWRSGVIAVKVGMTQEWDHWGAQIPITVLWIDDCQVVQVKQQQDRDYLSLQLGCGSKRPKQLSGSQRGHFEAAGVPLKRKLAEFRVSPEAVLPVGFTLTAAHFVAGQHVDVTGTTIGKGFQGVMKRWGFAGQPASHGNSLAHRGAGSTGGCQDPGKVFKGKKMAGRMGGERRTAQNCYVWRVDPQRNLLYLRGHVPGHKGNFVLVRDSVRKLPHQQPPLPIPSVTGDATNLQVTVAEKQGSDPYEYKET